MKILSNWLCRSVYLIYNNCNILSNERQLFSLNSIYFQISIYTWQHTSIQIHGKWIGKQVALNLYKFFSKGNYLQFTISRINCELVSLTSPCVIRHLYRIRLVSPLNQRRVQPNITTSNLHCKITVIKADNLSFGAIPSGHGLVSSAIHFEQTFIQNSKPRLFNFYPTMIMHFRLLT